MRKLNNGYLAAIIIHQVIIADQILKIWVKTSFFLYESLDITSWFKLNFVDFVEDLTFVANGIPAGKCPLSVVSWSSK